MDLSKFSLKELEDLLKNLPSEIARQEALAKVTDDDDAKRRKFSVWASMQELAKKQGIDLSKC